MTPETAQAIDQIQVNLNAGGMNTINIILAFVMFGVALGIKPGIFVEVFRKPKSVLLGMLCQLILLPAFTCLLAILLSWWISPMMGLGMILVASCPGGNISNFMSSLAKANIELSVSLTAISTALAILMTPFNFWLWGNAYLHFAPVAHEIPTLVIPLWDVFKTIFILLGIPLTLGILTSRFLPKVANALKKPLQWISLVFFIAMVVLSFSSNMDAFLKCVKYIFVVVLILTSWRSASVTVWGRPSRSRRRTGRPSPSKRASRTPDWASCSCWAPPSSRTSRPTAACSSSRRGGASGISSPA